MATFELAISCVIFLLFASGAILSIGLVAWEGISMRRHPKRPWLQFRLAFIGSLIVFASVTCGICTWIGWTVDTFTFTAIGVAVALGVAWFAGTVGRSWFQQNPLQHLRDDRSAVIAPPQAPSEKRAKRKRRPKSHEQPSYGRYGLWK